MNFGLQVPHLGSLSDPNLLVDLACEAEEAGWDGFFIWDDIAAAGDPPITDPWIVLAAIAVRTERVRLGPMIVPLARRRPWKVAREAVALDQISQGRFILGVGLGEPATVQFETFGEEGDPRVRADKLDEGLEILAGLWSGEPFTFQGRYYQIAETQFKPTPVQSPRIPIWVAGRWPNKRPFRRAARWDGVFPTGRDLGPDEMLPINELRKIRAYIAEHRSQETPLDVVQIGVTSGQEPVGEAKLLTSYAEAGVTWWLEDMNVYGGSISKVRERIAKGPPKN